MKNQRKTRQPGNPPKRPEDMTNEELSAWLVQHPEERGLTMRDAAAALLQLAKEYDIPNAVPLTREEWVQREAFIASWAKWHHIDLERRVGQLSPIPGKLEPLQ